MHVRRARRCGAVAAKGKTKTKDEAKRAEVTAKIQEISAATEADVRSSSAGLDP